MTVESSFSKAGYTFVVLSAEESSGLQGWLDENGYAHPAVASSRAVSGQLDQSCGAADEGHSRLAVVLQEGKVAHTGLRIRDVGDS